MPPFPWEERIHTVKWRGNRSVLRGNWQIPRGGWNGTLELLRPRGQGERNTERQARKETRALWGGQELMGLTAAN